MSLKRQRTRQKNPFSFSKKISAGVASKNMQRLFLAGAGQSLADNRRGLLDLTIFLKIGSSESVKTYHKRTFLEIVARLGGFIFGCAERKPNVLGGRNSLSSRWLRLFDF